MCLHVNLRVLVHNQNYYYKYINANMFSYREVKQWKNSFLASFLDNNIFYVDNFFLLRFVFLFFIKKSIT